MLKKLYVFIIGIALFAGTAMAAGFDSASFSSVGGINEIFKRIGTTISPSSLGDELSVDTITATNGTITNLSTDSLTIAVFFTGGTINVDTINEKTADNGIEIEDVRFENGNVEFDPTPIINLTANGEIVQIQVDTNTSGTGALLYLALDGNLDEAWAGTSVTVPGMALALTNTTGSAQPILLQGFYRDDSFTFSTGGLVYASTTTGSVTQTAPSTSGEQVQILGIATSYTEFYFDPNFMLIEVQ